VFGDKQFVSRFMNPKKFQKKIIGGLEKINTDIAKIEARFGLAKAGDPDKKMTNIVESILAAGNTQKQSGIILDDIMYLKTILDENPELNEQDLEYYKSMSNKQRNMTIINCNSDNWNNNKQIQRQLRILENNYQNFDNSLIKQPNNNGLSATHNLIGQPLFNNNIIIKAYDAVLNTSYYRDKVKIYDLQEDRYIRRYNI